MAKNSNSFTDKTYTIEVWDRSSNTLLAKLTGADHSEIAKLKSTYINQQNMEYVRVEYSVDNPEVSINLSEDAARDAL